MTDQATKIDINPQKHQSEDDMDTDDEPPVTAPLSRPPQPPSTQGESHASLVDVAPSSCTVHCAAKNETNMQRSEN